MEISDSLRNFLEIVFGVVYLIGAGFNYLYTLKHGVEFFRSFSEGTWFPPAKWFIRKFVIPSPRNYTLTLILYQLLVAIALLSRGPYVELGLLAGAAFCLYGVFVSNVPGAIGNLAMAAIQIYLASTR